MAKKLKSVLSWCLKKIKKFGIWIFLALVTVILIFFRRRSRILDKLRDWKDGKPVQPKTQPSTKEEIEKELEEKKENIKSEREKALDDWMNHDWGGGNK